MHTTRNIALLFFLFVALHSCEPLDSPGGGLGSVVNISDYKYKSEYYQKYSDSLFYYCPEFRIPDTIKSGGVEVAFPDLNMTSFYLNSPPREIYCVQWRGTGFISIRLAYDVDQQKEIMDNTKLNLIVPENEKQRIEKRFLQTILFKLDSLIAASPDQASAIFVKPF